MECKISIEPQGEVYRNIHIEIPHSEYSRRYNDALGKAATRVRLKGFRPGRAPKAMVAKLYGSEIHQEVMETLANNALRTAMSEHELEIVGRPEVKFKDVQPEKDVEITANVAVAPRPKIGSVKDLAFEVEVRSVSDEDCKRELESMQEQQATYTKIESRTDVRKDDYVLLEYDATVEGQPVPGTKTEKRFVRAGSAMIIKELDDAIIGMNKGESKEVQIPLSESFADPSVAGKTATYKVTVHELEEKELPEITDEFAKKTTLAETAAELQPAIRTSLEKAFEDQNKERRERKLFETLIERNPFEVPSVMVDEEIRSILFEMGALDRRSQKSYELDVSPFRKHLEAQALYRVKSLIALDQIIEQEKIEASDEDFEAWLEGLVTKGGFKSRDDLNKQLGLPAAAPRLKTICSREKVTEKLLAESKITEVPWKQPEAPFGSEDSES